MESPDYETLIAPTLLETINVGGMRALYNRSDNLYSDIWGKITQEHKKERSEDIAKYIRDKYGNGPLADFFKSAPGRDLFGLDRVQ